MKSIILYLCILRIIRCDRWCASCARSKTQWGSRPTASFTMIAQSAVRVKLLANLMNSGDNQSNARLESLQSIYLIYSWPLSSLRFIVHSGGSCTRNPPFKPMKGSWRVMSARVLMPAFLLAKRLQSTLFCLREPHTRETHWSGGATTLPGATL